MAMNLSLNTSVVSRDETARTSTISVSVVLTYSFSGTISYNTYTDDRGPTLSLTVGEWSGSFKVPFNTGKSSSGSDTLYSGNFTISHGSTTGNISVPISASYATNVTASVSPVSKTVTLAGMGSSGGSSGGDSGGDDDDDGGNTGGGTGGSSSGETIQRHPDTNCTYLGTSDYDRNYRNLGMPTGRNMRTYKWYIKFKTPASLTSSNSVTVRIKNYKVWSSSYEDNLTLSLFEGSVDGNDPIASTNALPPDFGVNYSSYDIVITTTKLKPNTEYVVLMKSEPESTLAEGNIVLADAPVGIIIDYSTTPKPVKQCYIGNVPYEAYIGNGTIFDKYEVYIGNGTTFVPYG